ncbi:hypothetical protein [Crenobacter caeni]|uniref:Uncharacterized protein n=1 Tax=Crenobacter caeni TaxID=2705474 RepID=A0A6B2KNA3_9NEIS|nr:hypothetical protein [Crenobacter caeni]NDV11644.1 hypothetical protein [Crenobacter caeni]
MISRMTIFGGQEVRVKTERNLSAVTGAPFWINEISIMEKGRASPAATILVYMDDETSDQLEQAHQSSQASKEIAA